MATKSPGSRKKEPSLAEEIQLATRSVHAKLNKLIIERLPLALPPRASSPSIYLSGLLHIAPIYITFEALWSKVVDAGHKDSTDLGKGTEKSAPGADKRIREVLHKLRLPRLMRSSRLKEDIQSLTGWTRHDVERQLQLVSETGRLGEFVSHIKRVIDRKPHVILAYSYIMFMALFAGGRIIRATLASAGSDFWDLVAVPPQCTDTKAHRRRCERGEQSPHGTAACSCEPGIMPLRFFDFQTPMEGEDLKHEFKRRLLESEKVLSDKERHDIVQEAVCIFDNMSLLVRQLDIVCLKQALGRAHHSEKAEDVDNISSYPMSTRLRDSVFVARERHAKASSRRISASEDGICATKASNDATGSTGSSSASHPNVTVPGLTVMELCPAFSKSMRFEKAFLKTSQVEDLTILSSRRGPVDFSEAAAEPTASHHDASENICGIHIRNWVIMAAFGVIILGALFTGRAGIAPRIVLRLQ